MRNFIWLIPVFPLAGFLINGLVYLFGNRPPRPRGQGAHGEHDEGGHGGHQIAAESAKSLDHPHAHSHAETHPRFAALHTIVGPGSVLLSMLFAFGAIFDIGLKGFAEGASHTVELYRWIPLGVNQAVGQVPGAVGEWFVNAAFRVDSLSALMLAFVTFVGFLIHVYSVGYMGHDRGYGRYFAYLNLFMFAMLVLVLGANFSNTSRRQQ